MLVCAGRFLQIETRRTRYSHGRKLFQHSYTHFVYPFDCCFPDYRLVSDLRSDSLGYSHPLANLWVRGYWYCFNNLRYRNGRIWFPGFAQYVSAWRLCSTLPGPAGYLGYILFGEESTECRCVVCDIGPCACGTVAFRNCPVYLSTSYWSYV